MPDAKDKMGWKVVGLAASLVAGAATRKAAEKIYQSRIGEAPPDRPASPLVPIRHAIIWAISSGAVAELVRLIIERSAAHAWVQTTGELPPGLDPEADEAAEAAEAAENAESA